MCCNYYWCSITQRKNNKKQELTLKQIAALFMEKLFNQHVNTAVRGKAFTPQQIMLQQKNNIISFKTPTFCFHDGFGENEGGRLGEWEKLRNMNETVEWWLWPLSAAACQSVSVTVTGPQQGGTLDGEQPGPHGCTLGLHTGASQADRQSRGLACPRHITGQAAAMRSKHPVWSRVWCHCLYRWISCSRCSRMCGSTVAGRHRSELHLLLMNELHFSNSRAAHKGKEEEGGDEKWAEQYVKSDFLRIIQSYSD